MFILGQVGSGVYQALLFLHVLSVIVAFSPTVVHAVVGPRMMKEDEAAGRRFAGQAAATNRSVHTPALLVAGLLGFALVGLSDQQWQFSDAWVWISAVLWLVIAVILAVVLIPGGKEVAAGDRAAESKVAAGNGVVALLAVAVLFLMVVKPG